MREADSYATLIEELELAAEHVSGQYEEFFENNLENDSWHRDLTNRMALSIEGVRPALLPKHQLEPFHELRAFRHAAPGS